MIKAIIFDCFGVLVRGSLQNFIDTHLAHDSNLVQRAHELNDQANAGFISYDEMLAEYAKLASISVAQTREEMNNTPRNAKLLNYISSELKGDCKIGFLSNAADDWVKKLFLAEDIELFDDFVLSYQHGVVKPDQKIYKIALQRLGVEPSETVFVDDIERYCIAASEAGMHAVHFRDTNQAIDEINSLLKVSDSDK